MMKHDDDDGTEESAATAANAAAPAAPKTKSGLWGALKSSASAVATASASAVATSASAVATAASSPRNNTSNNNINKAAAISQYMPGGGAAAAPSSGGLPGGTAGAGGSSWTAAVGQAVQSWTVRRYALPDKHVASQVLMYRQLLHTKCRPGLTLSRDYQGTVAQRAVLHMPWWSTDLPAATATMNNNNTPAAEPPGTTCIEQTGKMIISYDNLLARLWIAGACRPWKDHGSSNNSDHVHGDAVHLLLSENDKAPVPHQDWVDRLGFQQTDPVTDFRSGGILSLAMMVHLVESCPKTHARFLRFDNHDGDKQSGDAAVLPFGLTSINVTGMMSKFLMLSKSVDRMDALLSQKPFWRMFANPNALLVCQELAMELVAMVVVEFQTLRGPSGGTVTVFDFAEILTIVEQRMEHDLLGAGPKSVVELRSIFQKLQERYQLQLQNQVAKMNNNNINTTTTATTATMSGNSSTDSSSPRNETTVNGTATATTTSTTSAAPAPTATGPPLLSKAVHTATALGTTATAVAGSVLQKIKSPLSSTSSATTTTTLTPIQQEPAAPPLDNETAASTTTATSTTTEQTTTPASAAAEATLLVDILELGDDNNKNINHDGGEDLIAFSIDDDEEEDDDKL